jgi:SAM-dependent methyltransferase
METLSSNDFYDRLAGFFDVMTDWQKRLAFEMPFLLRTLDQHRARSILDTACGTGWHAIALTQKGYQTAGCDGSPVMIEMARTNAATAKADVRFEVADFNQLDKFSETFDAVLCLGNSLPHLLSQEALVEALQHMRASLRSEGVLILHNLNYDMRMVKKPRFFAVNGNAEALVWRFADYGPEFITFHTALFERKTEGTNQEAKSWSVQVNSTLQRPLLKKDLDEALARAGLNNIQHFGGLDGSPFEKEKSGDLVIVTRANKGRGVIRFFSSPAYRDISSLSVAARRLVERSNFGDPLAKKMEELKAVL